MGSDGADAAAAAPQQPQTQVGTLLRLLLEQQFRKLQKRRGVSSARQNHLEECFLRDPGPVSPSIPAPSGWRSSAAGRGRSGCRPCCAAAPSGRRRGCSPSTPSPTPSARETQLCTRSPLKRPMHGFILHLFIFTYLHNNLQSVQDNQVGLSCKISIDKCLVFQLCSGPAMKETEA